MTGSPRTACCRVPQQDDPLVNTAETGRQALPHATREQQGTKLHVSRSEGMRMLLSRLKGRAEWMQIMLAVDPLWVEWSALT